MPAVFGRASGDGAAQAAGRRWRDEGVIALVLCALAAGCVFGGWAWRLDRLVYDLGLSLWTRPPPPGLLIVAIDDASVQAIGRWPWSRAVHATLLERIAAAKPRAVALDLVLSEADADPRHDQLLAAALAHAAPVVLPLAWRAGPDAAHAPLLALQPTPALRGAVTLGAAEAPVDDDGVLRHAFLHAATPAGRFPHLALALLQAGGETLPAGFPVEMAPVRPGDSLAGGERDGRFLIRYAGPPGSVERVSYVDVLRGAVPAERLAGRYVLVGMTAQGLGDTLATPVNARQQAMPGIEVLAHTLYTLRSGDTILAVGNALAAAVAAVLLSLLLLAFARGGPSYALPVALLSVPLALAASLLALRGGVWCSPVPYALAATLAYPLWSWRRLQRAVAGLDQEIARWAVEPALPGTSQTMAQQPDSIDARLQTLQQAGTLVRQARSFLADALAAMPTAMLVADGAAHVVLANASAAALFDVESADDLQGLDVLRLLAELQTTAPVDWPAAIGALVPGAAGLAVEGRLQGAAGAMTGGEHVVHAAVVDLQGQRRLIVTLADLQPVKQAEQAREEALAFVSHDLRSPASSIVLLADLQLRADVPTAAPELLQELRRLATRTLQMSDDFVRASQVQRQPLQRSGVTVDALLEDALADLRPQAVAAGVQLQLVLRPLERTVPTELQLDRRLVARAIANLVSNAIRHSPPGGVVLVTAEMAEQHTLQLQVRDHGAGLSDQQLQQLAQGGRGLASQHARGVGLGLLFVQRVAQRHEGTLLAAAAPGGGALFTLQLPG